MILCLASRLVVNNINNTSGFRQPMSLSRRVLFTVTRSRPAVSVVQSRAASSSHNHHDHHEDTTVYPPETFINPFWGKVVFFSLLTGAAIKYAPEPSDDVYLTRWIAMYKATPGLWLELNARHTAQESQVSDKNRLIADAKLPPIHRFRYPQSLTQGSPFLNRVGETVDMRNVVAKTDKDVA